MSDFLGRLAARSLEPAPVVMPRLPSLFEPPVGPATLPATVPERPDLGREMEGRRATPPAVPAASEVRPEPRPAPPGRPDAARGGRDPAGEAPAGTAPVPAARRRGREPAPDAVARAPRAPASARAGPGAGERPGGRVAATAARASAPLPAPSRSPTGPAEPPSPTQVWRSARDDGRGARAAARPEERAELSSPTVGPVLARLAPALRAANEAPPKAPWTAAAPVPAQPAAPGLSPPSPPGPLAPPRLPHFPQLAALAPAARRPEPRPRVEVTIGRVEVRAASTSPAAPARRAPPSAAMSLEEYLRRRDGRQR